MRISARLEIFQWEVGTVESCHPNTSRPYKKHFCQRTEIFYVSDRAWWNTDLAIKEHGKLREDSKANPWLYENSERLLDKNRDIVEVNHKIWDTTQYHGHSYQTTLFELLFLRHKSRGYSILNLLFDKNTYMANAHFQNLKCWINGSGEVRTRADFRPLGIKKDLNPTP